MTEKKCAAAGCERTLSPEEKKYCPYHAGKRAEARRNVVAIATSVLGAVAFVARVIIIRRPPTPKA